MMIASSFRLANLSGAAAAVLLLTLPTSGATAASVAESLAICQEEERPETERIEACTAVVQSKGEPESVHAEALFNRAYAFEGLAKHREALADYDEAARLNPEYAAIYNYRGGLHETMGNLDLAVADFSTSIRLEPKEGYAYSRRGRIFLARGDLAKALADLDAAIANDAEDAAAYAARGTVHERQGRPDAALRDYRRALGLEPDNEEAQAGVRRLRGA